MEEQLRQQAIESITRSVVEQIGRDQPAFLEDRVADEVMVDSITDNLRFFKEDDAFNIVSMEPVATADLTTLDLIRIAVKLEL